MRAMNETVLIVGATGQDGTLLSRFHRRRGDRVVGLSRHGVSDGQGVCKLPSDLTHAGYISELIEFYQPNRIYYLAAYHHSSEDRPDGGATADLQRLFRSSVEINLVGWLNVLAAADRCRARPRLFYASSSLVFGSPATEWADEETPLRPHNAYGITKVSAMQAADFYRLNRDMHVSTGILFNHESLRRSPSFVTRKISMAAVQAALGSDAPLILRNPWATVDWTAAEDVVSAMALICDQDTPATYVVGSGILRSIMDFVEDAFAVLGLPVPKVQHPAGAVPSNGVSACAGKLRALGWEPRYPWPIWGRRMVRSEYRLHLCRAGR